jgi:hypothetical protein
MDIHEELVLMHLTKYPSATFVCPQFSIRSRNISGGEWSRPDFVALNFTKRIVSIVEVSTSRSAVGIGRLRSKVINRRKKWYKPLQKHLKGIIGKDWTYDVRIFVRRDMIQRFKNIEIRKPPSVIVEALEDAF